MIEAPDHIPDLARLKVFYAFIVLMLAIIVARLWFLQIVSGAELAEKAELNRLRLIRRVAARGVITDRNGHLLATNRSRFVVSVMPDEIKKNPQVLDRLAQILKTTSEILADTLDQPNPNPFDPIPVDDNVDMTQMAQIEEQKLDLPGVLVTKDPRRVYVDNELCTHVLGITRPITKERLAKLTGQGYRGGDMVGMEGLERVYEADLRGQDGGTQIAVNARGKTLRTMEEIKPTPGHTLRLTLDYDLQQVAYNGLMEAYKQGGHPGAAVALDVSDGSVLAFVSVPSYDLNRYGVDYGKLLKDTNRPLVNRASNSHYPCGSTFKLITAAAGLETQTTGPYTTDYCPGFMKLGNRIFHCDKLSGHGSIDFEEAIGESCDVFFWHAAQRVGVESLIAEARRFGLGQTTGIDLPASPDSKGLVPSPEWKAKTRRGVWQQGDLLNMAIGQGYVGVTPLQLADYTAAIANGGTLWRPQLVRSVVDPATGQVIRALQPEARGSLGLKPANRDAIVRGMQRVFDRHGTAYGLAIPGLSVAAKTGTAQVTQTISHSVFVCFAPVDHPKIAIAVLVEKAGHGSDVAAPIARRMLCQFFGRKDQINTVPIGKHYGTD